MANQTSGETIRYFSFLGIVAALFCVLGVRLFELQVLQGNEYREKSDSNRIRLVETTPPRGVMRDRHGRLLLTNRASYSCWGVPRELWNDRAGLELLSGAMRKNTEFVRQNMIKPFRSTFQPMRIERDLSFGQLSAFEEMRDRIPGAFLELEQQRYYSRSLAAHALGYVSEVSKDELEKFPYARVGDLVGKRGLERIYDEALRGVPGRRFSIVNAHGQEIADEDKLDRIEPIAGKELWLSIDADVQALAESLMTGKIGAVVAMDVRNGGVVCMASAPTYDPQVFAGRIDSKEWNRLLTDPQKPMLNRASQTMYPPGSTIKMAMLTEALESKTITPAFTASCPGHYTVGNRTFKCWNKKGHGSVNVYRAIEESCDVFFYKVGMMLGADGINRALARYHFGTKTGVDQTSEADGLIPSEAYYNKRYGPSGWTKGFIPSIAIGQGEVLVTPLQLCAYACAVGDGKVWKKPFLVSGVYDPQTKTLQKREAPPGEPLSCSPENMAIVREGARRVVWGGGGTARRQQDEDCPIAGKTGTAQNAHGDDHAWFVGYAPYDDPIVACCVLVEFGEHGSSAAAPIAKEVMRAFVLSERGIDNPPISANLATAE
ncbi:penicillin-binding protein 2 [candidate division KSB1 bacterium]|nr:penicillin-binding protein 2 [candidate division KSB1 bacterium]